MPASQWILPLALVAGMLLMHRISPGGGCCGGHGGRGGHGGHDARRPRREKEQEPAAPPPGEEAHR